MAKRYYSSGREIGKDEAREIVRKNKEITSKPVSEEWLKVQFVTVLDTEHPERRRDTTKKRRIPGEAAKKPAAPSAKKPTRVTAKNPQKTVRKWREVKVNPSLGVRTVVTVSEDGTFRQSMYDCQTGRKFREYTMPVKEMGYENVQALLRDHKNRGRNYTEVTQGGKVSAAKPKKK